MNPVISSSNGLDIPLIMRQRILKRVQKEYPFSSISLDEINVRIETATFATEKLSKKFKGTYKKIEGLKGYSTFRAKPYTLYCSKEGDFLELQKEEKIEPLPKKVLASLKKEFSGEIKILSATSEIEIHLISDAMDYYCTCEKDGYNLKISRGGRP